VLSVPVPLYLSRFYRAIVVRSAMFFSHFSFESAATRLIHLRSLKSGENTASECSAWYSVRRKLVMDADRPADYICRSLYVH